MIICLAHFFVGSVDSLFGIADTSFVNYHTHAPSRVLVTIPQIATETLQHSIPSNAIDLLHKYPLHTIMASRQNNTHGGAPQDNSTTTALRPLQMGAKGAYIVRLLMVGDSSCGKTSLVLRFDQNVFSTKFVTTIGVDYRDKMVKVSLSNDCGGCCLSCWLVSVRVVPSVQDLCCQSNSNHYHPTTISNCRLRGHQ